MNLRKSIYDHSLTGLGWRGGHDKLACCPQTDSVGVFLYDPRNKQRCLVGLQKVDIVFSVI